MIWLEGKITRPNFFTTIRLHVQQKARPKCWVNFLARSAMCLIGFQFPWIPKINSNSQNRDQNTHREINLQNCTKVSKQTKHLATYACNYYNIFAYIIYVYAHFFFPINVFHNHIFFLITWKLWNNRCLKGRTWKNSGLTGNNIIAHIPGFARQMVSNKITTQNTSVNGIQLRMSTKTWINITARLVFPDKIHCGLFDSIKTLETAKFRNNRQFSYRFQPVPIQNRRIHPTPTCLKNLEHWGKSGNHSWNQVGP